MPRFALLVVLALGAAAPAQDSAKRHAVIIGVNDYDHPKLPALRFSVNDAVELAGVLKPAGYDVTLLCDGSGPKPTKANIDAALRAALSRCRRGDTVVVAFSGHGLQFQGTKDAYFCPSDARPSVNGKDSLVSLSKLYADLEDSFAGVKVLLVDACRNDPGPDKDEAIGLRGVDADSAPNPPRGVAAFFSCSAGEQAVEHGSVKHGVFFHYVLEGLRGKARDEDGEVTFNTLAGYVAKNVSKQVPALTRGLRKQSPNQKADLSGASPVLLSLSRPAAPAPPAAPADPGAAAFDRGLALYLGRGVTQDLVAAERQFRAVTDDADSSKQSRDETKRAMARYYVGRILRLRHDKSCYGLLRAASFAVYPGKFEFATLSRFGIAGRIDTTPTKDVAHEVFRGAERSAPVVVGQTALGEIYLFGLYGQAADEAKALRYLQRADREGEPEARWLLGRMYAGGLGGLKKDEAEAVRRYRSAADLGIVRAMLSLGECYERGAGVGQDPAAAAEWYRKAADSGYADAQFALGALYEAGRGVGRDRVEALRWYVKADNQSHIPARQAATRLVEAGVPRPPSDPDPDP